MLLEAAAKLDPSTICTWIGAEGCSDGFQNTGGNAAVEASGSTPWKCHVLEYQKHGLK
jgi:hypothetical protein